MTAALARLDYDLKNLIIEDSNLDLRDWSLHSALKDKVEYKQLPIEEPTYIDYK